MERVREVKNERDIEGQSRKKGKKREREEKEQQTRK